MGTFKAPKFIRDLAKQMDTPEMRELYKRQQVINPNLNQDCDEAGEEIQDIFKHIKDSVGDLNDHKK